MRRAWTRPRTCFLGVGQAPQWHDGLGELVDARSHGTQQAIDDTADPERLAALLLTVVRGIEAVGKAGLDPETVRNVADTALAALPAPEGQKRPTTGRTPARGPDLRGSPVPKAAPAAANAEPGRPHTSLYWVGRERADERHAM